MPSPDKIQRRKTASALCAAALLAFVAGRAWRLRGEDFLYYYCAGRVAAAGRSPYDPAQYQACIAGVLGHPNTNISRASGSAYPPPVLPLFGALARLDYPASFKAWNAALLLASLWLLWTLRAEPMDGLLLLTWPGFVLC
ncbi:MAG TPA: hypothetical protein VMU54_09310, partial [Planctomycetota bacterium]|nr:hypothetical protein [Planctomycetota bacterium]